jgi:GR25 family glycosyltransferase involved in LPS biosynthesis
LAPSTSLVQQPQPLQQQQQPQQQPQQQQQQQPQQQQPQPQPQQQPLPTASRRLGDAHGSRSDSDSNANSFASVPFERAYVINLEAARERWERVVEEFHRIGVKPARVEAVNGPELSRPQRAALCTRACAARCTPGMIGCGASHLKTWQRMLAEHVRVALVCEDDVEFVDNFWDTLFAYAAEFPPGWDVIYLSCVGCSPRGGSMILGLGGYTHASRDVSEHVWVPPAALTTACYLVSAAGARKLLAHLSGRLHTHVDVMMNDLAGRGMIAAYAVRPLLASQRMEASEEGGAGSRASSILTSRTPRGPTMLLDNFLFADNMTWGYVATAPFAKLGPFTLNAWAPLFLASGAVCGLLKTGIWGPVALCVLLLCMDVLPLLQGDGETGVTVAVSCALAALGWVCGLAVAALAGTTL